MTHDYKRHGTTTLFAALDVKSGTFSSVAELKDAIHDYLDSHTADPKPFVWAKSAEVILEEERRALDAFEAIKAGNQPSDSEH